MTATGSRAARLLSNILMAEWRSSIGPNIKRTEAEQAEPRHRRKKETTQREDRRGHGRVASPGQRRRSFLSRPSIIFAASATRSRSSIRRAFGLSPVRPIRKYGWHLDAAGRSASYSRISSRPASTSRPKGPIGWAARNWCLKNGAPFTTAFHTRFPDYVSIRTGIRAEWIWKVMRRFHGPAERTFTATPTLAAELHAQGLSHTHHWPRGVDLEQFHPEGALHPAMANLPRPILLCVGRVAVEKNIEAFLDCPVEGSKVVVGDGPALAALQRGTPRSCFLARSTAPSSLRLIVPATFSFFRAAPTPSAW